MNKKHMRLGLVLVALVAIVGIAVGADPLTAEIKVLGTIVIGESTVDKLKVDFGNFTDEDPWIVRITNVSTSTVVFNASGNLGGGTVETISIDWTPQYPGDHLVEVYGLQVNLLDHTIVGVYDSGTVNPVPELYTVILTSAGVVGLLGIRKWRKEKNSA